MASDRILIISRIDVPFPVPILNILLLAIFSVTAFSKKGMMSRINT